MGGCLVNATAGAAAIKLLSAAQVEADDCCTTKLRCLERDDICLNGFICKRGKQLS